MKKILFLLLLPTLLNVVYGCKGGGILNANANIEKTYNGHELKFIAFKVYNSGLISEKSKDLLNLFKHMRMTIIKDTLIINDDNKIVFSIQQADSKQFYNHRYGISNFYAKELDKLGYKDGSNTITFLKPEDYAGQETWSRNYIDMLGLGVIAGKYIFFPCILTGGEEENAMLIYEIPQKVKFSNTIDNRGVRSDKGGLKQVARTPFDNFFVGKYKDLSKKEVLSQENYEQLVIRDSFSQLLFDAPVTFGVMTRYFNDVPDEYKQETFSRIIYRHDDQKNVYFINDYTKQVFLAKSDVDIQTEFAKYYEEDKFHVISYYQNRVDDEQLTPTVHLQQSFAQMKKLGGWKLGMSFSDFDSERKIVEYMRYVRTYPILSNAKEGLSQFIITATGIEKMRVSSLIAETPIPSKNESIDLMSGKDLMDQILGKGIALDTLEDIRLGYSWQLSRESNQIVEFVPNWFIKIDHKWKTLGEVFLPTLDQGGDNDGF